MLVVNGLRASVGEKEILQGLNLTVNPGGDSRHHGAKWFR